MEAGMYLKLKKDEHLKNCKEKCFSHTLQKINTKNHIKPKKPILRSNASSKHGNKSPQNSCPQLNTFVIKENISIDKQELLNNHIHILKTQLKNAGIKPVDEIIPYEIGKNNLKIAFENLMKNNSHINLVEFEKWENFVQNHPDYSKEENERQNQWLHEKGCLGANE